MFHFLKYVILSAILFSILNLFRSNMGVDLSLKFDLPFVLSWQSPLTSLNILLLSSFCAGILFGAFFGAFRFSHGRATRKKVRELEKSLEEARSQLMAGAKSTANTELPSLAK